MTKVPAAGPVRKILYVSDVVPDPKGAGSPQRAAMHLQVLRQLGEVTLVVPPVEGRSRLALEGLRVLERAHSIAHARSWRHDAARSPLKRAFHALMLRNFVDGRASRDEVRRFRAALPEPFDLVFAFRLHSAIWCDSVFGRGQRKQRIADLDDIESIVFAKRIEQPGGPWPWRLKLQGQLRWLRRAERRVAEQWDAVCLCSRLDADRFAAATGVEPWIVPNACVFGPTAPEPPAPPCRVLFVGTFGYFANVEGVAWFVEAIWPLVRAELGEAAELTLVGLTPPPAILALDGRDGITVAANVPSVDPYYEAAHVVVAPLRTGSGTRIKLIEAAARRRAIVTTTLGCEGLGFVDGVHAEIADDPAAFAARIVALAGDPQRREHRAEACRELARQAFSAETVSAGLSERIAALFRRK